MFVPYIDPPTTPAHGGIELQMHESQLNYRTEGQETLRQTERGGGALHEASSESKKETNPDVFLSLSETRKVPFLSD